MKRLYALLALIIPAAIYFKVVGTYAVSSPVMDDYDAILNYLIRFRQAAFWSKLSMLFEQANEHRMFHSRLIYLLYYYITGNVDFRNLIFLANAQLIVISLICTSFISELGFKFWPVAAVLFNFCLFDLADYEAGSIAMYGIVNFGIIMLFVLALWLFHHDKLFLGNLTMFVLIFSNGNGMIGAMCVLLYLIVSKKKYGWTMYLTCVCILHYFINGYVFITQPGSHGIDIEKSVTFFIQMTGAHFSFSSATGCGIVLYIVLFYSFPYKYFWQYRIFICILFFLLGSMFTTALFRANVDNAQFQSSRYLIYPSLLTAITLMFLLSFKRTIFTPLIILAVLWTYTDNYKFGVSGWERTQWRVNYTLYYYPDYKRAKIIIDSACTDGIYCQ